MEMGVVPSAFHYPHHLLRNHYCSFLSHSALYMTPEFRRALYTWNFDEKKDGAEEHSIPLQLQKLFGMLQLSKSRDIDTKALTKSFGWDSGEVFQQQDIEELCRKLFAALKGA